MISVCVPVYNTDVRPLALQLSNMAGKAPFPVEILLFDDFSLPSWHETNREALTFPGVTYQRMEKNRGRAAIRNILGKTARLPWLLFLDADSMIPEDDFLKRYAAAAEKGGVICGGTLYHEVPPADNNLLLRWTYGRKREQRPAAEREKENTFAITANNFMIERDVFLKHPFRETIRGYGHEDTVLGYDLHQAGITIRHTDNSVFHTGLEPSAHYLEKTKAALGNLSFISRELIQNPHFQDASGLLRMVKRLNKYGLQGIASTLFRWCEPLLRRNLTGSRPSLLLFDLFRTGYLCTLQANSTSE